MRNYISFLYDNDSRMIAIIRRKGKTYVVIDSDDIKKLREICKKYNEDFFDVGVINNRVFSILGEFDSYLERKKRKEKIVNKLIIYQRPRGNTRIVRKDPTIGKAILMGTLIMALASIPKDGYSFSKIEVPIPDTLEEFAISDTELVEDEVLDNNIDNQLENNYEEDNQINEMFYDEFHFSYPDRSSDENMDNARRYEDLFTIYANRYGVDKNLLMAMASQESAGEHYDNLYNGPAGGIMQIERSALVGEKISAYNFDTDEVDSIVISNDDINDLETNIQIGAMDLRSNLEKYNYNIPLALQAYNYGPGNIYNLLDVTSSNEGIGIDELTNNLDNTEWLNYRNSISAGDSNYVEHVLSFLDSDTVLTFLKQNGEEVNLKIVNDYQKEKEL